MSADPTLFDVVRFYDPELVGRIPGGELGKYAVHRDISQLDLGDAKPVIFKCRALTRDQRRQVREQSSDDRRYELAFRFGVLAVKNLPGPSGPRDLNMSRARPSDALDDAAIDATGLGDVDIAEVGSAVMARSFLALGAPPTAPVLDSSRRAYGGVVSLLAEQMAKPLAGEE